MRLDGEKAYFDDEDPALEAELLALGHEPDELGPFSVFSLHEAASLRLRDLSLARDLGDKTGELLKRIDVVKGLHDQLATRVDQLRLENIRL